MRFKERKVKRIYAFVLMFIIVFQSVLGLDQRYLVNGATMDVEDSGESYYTVYFSASEILEQDSFIQNGVYLYAYDTDSDGTEVKGLEQPVQMTESELGENLYEYRLDNPYTIVEFMLGDSVDEAIKSDPINVDWMNYSKPCFTMELATENSSESGVIDGAASATSVKLQVLDITDLKNLEQAATLSDEENLESGSDSETDSESENDSESSSVPETLSEDEEAEVSAVPVGNTSSLAGKTLYFDSTNFPIGTAGSIQVGTADLIGLTVDSDSSMLSYTFPTDTSATHDTILTYITADGTRYHFRWSDTTYNKVTLANDMAAVSEKYVKATTVYFDATLSKLHYTDDGSTQYDYEIPKKGYNVYYYATGDGKNSGSHTMEKVGDSDIYKAELEAGYDKIVFSNFNMSSAKNYGGHGESTTTLTIPVGLKNPCFYADSSDLVIYEGGQRGGYWAELGSVRDAESGKGTDVVDIDKEKFESGTGTLYVNSTFYDYYTDYELNGSNRDGYCSKISKANEPSYRRWNTFRQFDQALSDYYETNSVSIPIYTGHFQPTYSDWKYDFAEINKDLNLFGFENYYKFISTNNSNFDVNGKKLEQKDTSSVAQGLVASTRENGSLMMATSSGVVSEPHFDEDFLLGNNSKNAVLGEVYQNVAFPFVQKDVDDTHDTGVKYWCFDSKKTTLAMKQDTVTDAYYLKDVGNQVWSENVNSSSSNKTGDVSTPYGFFPFNETLTAASAENYNYGFGVKLEFQFRLTEDGTVVDNEGKSVPITFNFSGDDDVWVFIDDQLVLDMGGAHGIATGKIDFQSKKATVDKVKASAGYTNDTIKGTPGTVTTNFSLNGSNAEEHTLTMYYMERGMWESNMMITFNFPDENQLEVEKQVDETDVNELFKGLFDDKSLFTYTIKNQATHYGAKEVSTGEATLPQTFYSSSNDGILNSVSGNTFETSTSLNEQSDLIHWYAKLEDKTGSWRDQRYGTITSTSSEGIDISNMSYLQFKFYYDYNDTPSFSNMYLQLVDKNEKIKGNITDYLSSKTYGIIPLSGKKWITIKINLSDLEEQSGFDKTSVTKIKFGYNYPRNIYLDDFIFYPSVVSSKLVGFITKQYDIPDYGSAASRKLEIPKGAVYSSSTGENRAIAEDGTFVLKNNETVTFSDQFRRGSYIYLEEEKNDLFQTSWTMYDNGMAVTSFGTGKNVSNGRISSMKNVSSTVVNDDRTETVISGNQEDASKPASDIDSNNYKRAARPEGAETFVFRSYNNPDDVTTTTKLKIVYTNKVKTGSLMIYKKSLYDGENLDGEYTFHVTFYNVGGIGLESSSIKTSFTLKAGKSYKIEGIPLGTCYSIQEEVPTDSSHLGNVKISNLSAMMIDTSSMTVQGVITEKADDVTFYNTLEPKISASVTKLWKDEVTGKILQNHLPDSIYVQLQRKQSTQNDDAYAAVVLEGGINYSRIEIVPSYGQNGDILWEYTASGLDKIVDYKDNPSNTTQWVYRFVELDKDGNVVENGKILTLTTDSGEEDFRADYETNSNDSGDYTTTITNTLLGSVNLHIIKTSAENDERLPGVKFQLEKWNQSNGTYDKIGEKTTSENSNNDLITGGETLFKGLENGTYRLTELQTAEGYTLLKSPVILTIDRKTDTYSYKMEGESTATSLQLINDVNGVPTLTLSIKNTTNMTLPQTGVRVPVQGVAAGALLCLLAGIMYMIESKRRRKEGKGLLSNNNMYSRQDNWASGVMEKKKERNEKMKKQSKIKRIVTALLALVLTVSMLPVQTGMTAFADTTLSTIDTEKKGSLTIHKYEYNGTVGNQGTGSESDTVPTDAKALKGVTFKITKFADIEDIYEITGNDIKNIEEAKSKIDSLNNLYIDEKITDENGLATFTNLDLGLYYVEETNAPDKITGKTAPFVVSIPMTMSTNDANTTNTQWNYDVHVYPKNQSTTATVNLKKINGGGYAVGSATFALQKQNEGGNTWTTVTEDADGEEITNFNTDSNGLLTITNLAPGKYRFVETGVPENSGYIMDGATVYEFEIAAADSSEHDSEDNLIYKKGAVLIGGKSVDTSLSPIIATNHKPDVEKEVCTGTDVNGKTWGDASDYTVGDKVPYRIKVDVPENVGKLKKFTITDILVNQTYSAGSANFKIFSDAACENEILSDEYTVNTLDNNSGWSIEFNKKDEDGSYSSILDEEGIRGNSIYIYFEATLDGSAVTTNVGNPNTVKLEYSNEILPKKDDGNPNWPDNPENPEDPKTNTITDQATVYTFKIKINKTANDEQNKALSGVQFDLYREDNDGKEFSIQGLPEGKYTLVEEKLTTDESGIVSSKGLENGTYYLVETKTADGYNLLKAPVKVVINVQYTTEIKVEEKTEDGVTTITRTVSNKEYKDGESATDGIFTQKIVNSKGFTLPTTGGIGTYIFFIVGISMMAAAVILFVRSKKKEDVK